jgi:hypothetical protein
VKRAVDALDGTELELAEGTLRLTTPGRTVRMVELSPGS